MSEVNVQIQNPQQTVNINNPSITIEIADDSIEVEFSEGQPIEIQVQNPVIEVNIGGACDCGGHEIQDEGTPLTQRGALNFVGAGVTVTDDSGNDRTTVTISGGGGGASYTEITYADMQTAIAGGTLTPGGWYLITDAPGTDLGFLTHAVTENSISVAGVGGYLNADFQDVGNYDGVEGVTGIAVGARHGIWRTLFEALTINYTNLSGGTFAVGDTITGGTTGATAVITSDDGVSALTAYMTSAGVAFDGSEVLDNDNGVTADMTAIETGPTIQSGDIVIWNLLHWQLTDDTLLDGTDPATNTAAYTQLFKEDAEQGYITAWDVSEFDFSLNDVVYRQDSRGGLVRGATGVVGYQFGRDTCAGNNIQSPDTFDIQNLVAAFNNKTTFPGAIVSEIVTGADTAIENNILENGASLTGITAGANCSISRNKIGQGATLGDGTTIGDGSTIDGNVIENEATIDVIAAGTDCQINKNNVGLGSSIKYLEIGNNIQVNENIIYSDTSFVHITAARNCTISKNIVYSGGSFEYISLSEFGEVSFNIVSNQGIIFEITVGDNCKMFRNEVGQGASLGGSMVLEADAQVNDNTILNGIAVSNKTFSAGVLFNGNTIGVTMDEAETITDNIEGKRAIPGFSDIPGTIDITGLTTLDCTAALAQYRGIYNLTSSNATEAIDTIANPPTAFPFTIRPAAGLVLTVTGTAYSGIAAGQIALKATDYVLDGDKGEYIVLEIDPLGTGALIEKYVVNGLL